MRLPRLALLLLVGACLALPGGAADFEDATAIARRALDLTPGGNWMLKGTLTTKEAEEPAKSPRPESVKLGRQPVTVQIMAFGDGTREIIYRCEREDRFVRGMRFLFPRAGSTGGLRVMELDGVTPVKDPHALFLGSAFTAEDLGLGFLAWKSQELLGLDTHRDRNCWRIVSRATKSDQSAYDRVDCWIDQEYFALLRAIARDAEGNPLREFDVRSFQKLEKVWMLKRLDLSAPSLGIVSRLDIQDAKRE